MHADVNWIYDNESNNEENKKAKSNQTDNVCSEMNYLYLNMLKSIFFMVFTGYPHLRI